MEVLDKPLISVITVCYNAEKTIEKTILSVYNQTYPNIEYIIVDGESKDNTLSIISKHHDKIAIILSEKDNGLYDAMNKGIDLATGEWAIFMNAGDEFYADDVIEKVFSIPYDKSTKLIYGDVMLNFGSIGTVEKKLGKLQHHEIPFDICHQSVFTSLDILKEIKYDTSYKICADCDSFNKIQKMGYNLQHASVVVSSFEVVEGVSSTKMILSFNEHCRIKNESPNSIRNIAAKGKVYIKTLLYKMLPSSIYNKIRFNSIKSRPLYNY